MVSARRQKDKGGLPQADCPVKNRSRLFFDAE